MQPLLLTFVGDEEDDDMYDMGDVNVDFLFDSRPPRAGDSDVEVLPYGWDPEVDTPIAPPQRGHHHHHRMPGNTFPLFHVGSRDADRGKPHPTLLVLLLYGFLVVFRDMDISLTRFWWSF